MSHYDTLNVPRSATADDIKKSYKHLARQHHPDKGGNSETFVRIQAAYEILIDEQKRTGYDQELDNPFAGQQGGHPFGGGHPFDFFMNFGVNHMFSRMNMQNTQFNQPRRKLPDVVDTIPVTLHHYMNGIIASKLRSINQRCPSCYTMCDRCNGQGMVMRPFIINGQFATTQQLNCGHCQGKGLVLAHVRLCQNPLCNAGFIHKNVDCKIDVPAHRLEPGKVVIRFAGLGEQSTTYLDIESEYVVQFANQLPPNVSIEEKRVLFTPTVPFKTMLCGGSISVPNDLAPLLSATEIMIPPMSVKPGWELIIKGKGCYKSETERDDLVVRPTVNYDNIKVGEEVKEALTSLCALL